MDSTNEARDDRADHSAALRKVLGVLILPLSIGLALVALAATVLVAMRRLLCRLTAGRS